MKTSDVGPNLYVHLIFKKINRFEVAFFTVFFVKNNLVESAAGVIPIRAFKKEDKFFTKNLDLIDTNASPFSTVFLQTSG